MSALVVIHLIAILSCGLMTGILFGDRMGPVFARPTMSASSFIQQQQIIHRHYVRLLPVLSLGSILGALAWLLVTRTHRSTLEFWLVALAAFAIIAAAVTTVRVNFPINAQLMTWNPAAPPENWREIWGRWERVHSIRTVLWLGAFALEVLALSLSASRTSMVSGG